MTIAVSLKVNDGVVLAADSATTLIGQSPDGSVAVVNVYNNANKIFNLVKDRPIGVVTWGAGSIGTASVSTLVKDLRARLSGKLSEFPVDLTIKHSRFAPGAPTAGGPVEIAAISKHEGFRWIQRKYYYSRDLNQEEAQR